MSKLKRTVKYITVNSYTKNKSFGTKQELFDYVIKNDIQPQAGDEYLKYKEVITNEYKFECKSAVLSVTNKQKLFNVFCEKLRTLLKEEELKKYSPLNERSRYVFNLIYWYHNKNLPVINYSGPLINKLVERAAKNESTSPTFYVKSLKLSLDASRLGIYYNINFSKHPSHKFLIISSIDTIIETNDYHNIEFYFNRQKLLMVYSGVIFMIDLAHKKLTESSLINSFYHCGYRHYLDLDLRKYAKLGDYQLKRLNINLN